MQNNFSEARIENIMQSLSGIKPAVAPDFFYTRLKGKLQMPEEKALFVLRPAFITAMLSIFLILNLFSLLDLNKTEIKNSSGTGTNSATIESFAKAYNLTGTESVYE